MPIKITNKKKTINTILSEYPSSELWYDLPPGITGRWVTIIG